MRSKPTCTVAVVAFAIFLAAILVNPTVLSAGEVGTVYTTVLDKPVQPSTGSNKEGEVRWQSNFPENLDSYRPYPIPVPTEPKSPTVDGGRMVSYDVLTGKTTINDKPFGGLPKDVADKVLGAMGVYEGNGEDPRALGFSALTQVLNPEDHPWAVNCKVWFSNTQGNWVASGVLIDCKWVLTAGHVVHEGNGGTWSTNVVCAPAYNGTNRPYGDANGLLLGSWNGWVINGDFNWDMGVIELDRPVGCLTGWHGYGWNLDCNFYLNGIFNNPGYPAEAPYPGNQMYTWSGDYDVCVVGGKQYQINNRAYGGQSGSGAYVWDGAQSRIVYTVVSNGTTTWARYPSLEQSQFLNIRDDWIGANRPTSLDLAPLWVKTTPASTPCGTPLSSMTYVVCNLSTFTYNGNVNVNVYLSTNQDISTSDRLIQSHFFNYNFGPKSSVLVNVTTPPTIPADVTGPYYIGVILDFNDWDIANNDTDGQDASHIDVTPCQVLDPPTNCSATDHRCDIVRLFWDYFGCCQDGFKIWRNGILIYTGFDPNQRQYNDNVACGTYNYEIKAWNPGGDGPSCFATGTRVCPPGHPGPVVATDNNANWVDVTWNNVPNETGYRVWRNGVEMTTVPANTTTWRDNNAFCNTTYNYCVEAYNNCGPSAQRCDDGRRFCDPMPICRIDPPTWDYGPVQVGNSVDKTFRIWNDGGGNLTGNLTESCSYYSIIAGGGGYSIPGGGWHDYTVRYSPGAVGPHTCNVQTGSVYCNNVFVEGVGVDDTPICRIDPPTWDYGTISVNTWVEKTFRIWNDGGGLLTGNLTESCSHYSIMSGAGAYAIPGGGWHDFVVRFWPTVAGYWTCNVATNSAWCPNVFVEGTGDGVCQGPRVIATDFEGWQPQQKWMYVALQQSPVDVDAFTMDLLYDTNVLRYDFCEAVDLTQNWLITGCSENNAGEIRIQGINPLPAPPIPAGSSGNLIRLYFTVIGCSFDGQTSTLTPANLADDFEGMQWCTGTFTCRECVSDGDVTNDGSLTAGDALCCFNISLLGGNIPPSCDVPAWDCELIACDVNCDNSLTAGDALDIFNRSLLGGGPQPCFSQFNGAAASAGAEVNAFDVPLKDVASAGNTLSVPVMMEATRGQAAFGFEVLFDTEKVKFDGMTIREAAEHWKGLGAKELEPGRVRVMGFDTEGLKGRHVAQGATVEIAELRFEKLSDDAQLGSVQWIEQRLDREPFEEPETTPDRVTKLDLSRPYPNPFRDAVSANVLVPSDQVSTVRVAVYDVKGRVVRVLLNESVSGGSREVTWDRRTSTGQQVSSGIYFLRMEVKESGFAQTRKLVVLK